MIITVQSAMLLVKPAEIIHIAPRVIQNSCWLLTERVKELVNVPHLFPTNRKVNVWSTAIKLRILEEDKIVSVLNVMKHVWDA